MISDGVHASPKRNNTTSPKSMSSKKLRIESDAADISFAARNFADDIDWGLDDFNGKENSSPNVEYKNIVVEELDILSWKRCTVESVKRDGANFDLILQLCEENDIGVCICRLQGVWAHTNCCVGDLLSIKGIWCDKFKCYVVNNANGFVITFPDHLVSGTTVVGGLFCKRKGILQEKFRGIDPGNKIMLIGSLVHEIFQDVLNKKLKTFSEISNAAKLLIYSKETAYELYSRKISIKEIEDELQPFLPKILEFVQTYLLGVGNSQEADNQFNGIIQDIEDIEENLWVPRLGLKGKIDVSVNVRPKSSSKFFTSKQLLPLELKTGKASFSIEHKGQVTLYQMMLEELGENVQSGLLLYLREGVMKEIRSSRNEKRDLIMLRNEVTNYLARKLSVDIGNQNTSPISLPEPINRYNACVKCPYNTICCTFMKRENDLTLEESHPLKKVSSEVTSHIKPSHIDYFMHWCGILSLEENEDRKNNQNKSIWVETPEFREENGRALINLEIKSPVIFSGGKFHHTFVKKYGEGSSKEEDDPIDFTMSEINISEYVIISSTDRIAISAGFVVDIQLYQITVSMDKDLSKKKTNKINNYIIDKHDSTSANVFNFTNLGLLLDNTERAEKMRELIIDKAVPKFSKVLPKIIAEKGVDILVNLNKIQRNAVLKALTTNDYMLIKGLPGTGKTQTLVAIIRLFDMMGKSVLITSHTHSAVDNILVRLRKHNVRFLRLGSDTRIKEELHEYSESQAVSNCKTPEEYERVYSLYNIVAVTCLGSAHPLFTSRQFDICIVDEATQVFQPSVLRPLFFADRFILVGDPDQLPPLVHSKTAKQMGAETSLFEHLDSDAATSVLTVQYRMNKYITKLANDLIYDGNLKCANEDIMFGCLEGLDKNVVKELSKDKKWLLKALEKHIDFSVVVLDTLDCTNRNQSFIEARTCSEISPRKGKHKRDHCTNYSEAAIVLALLKALISAGYAPENIGVIAPYRAQVMLLKKLLQESIHYSNRQKANVINIDGVEVNTVDQFQGRDKELILYSGTKTGPGEESQREKNSILEDKRRLTVAITRSKYKLIMIADKACLNQFTPFKELFMKIPSRCNVTLEDNKMGFSWFSLMDYLNVISKEIN